MKPTWKGRLVVKGRFADAFGPGDGGGLRLELGAKELPLNEGFNWLRSRWAKRWMCTKSGRSVEDRE